LQPALTTITSKPTKYSIQLNQKTKFRVYQCVISSIKHNPKNYQTYKKKNQNQPITVGIKAEIKIDKIKTGTTIEVWKEGIRKDIRKGIKKGILLKSSPACRWEGKKVAVTGRQTTLILKSRYSTRLINHLHHIIRHQSPLSKSQKTHITQTNRVNHKAKTSRPQRQSLLIRAGRLINSDASRTQGLSTDLTATRGQ